MSADAHSAQDLMLDRLQSLQISSSSPVSSLAGAAATTTMTLPAPAYFDLLPDELVETIIEHLQDDWLCDEVLALGQCDRRLAALVRSKQWQVIDSRHYRNPVALQELRKHADLVRRAAIRGGPFEPDHLGPDQAGTFLPTLWGARYEVTLSVPVHQASDASSVLYQLSLQVEVLTVQFDTVHDTLPPLASDALTGEPEALCDLAVRLHGQKGAGEDPRDPIPWALAECHLLRHLSLELPTARLHSTFSPLDVNASSFGLTCIELCCNAISLWAFTAFLANPAAANLVVVKIKASLIGVHGDVQPALLTRLQHLELVANPRGSRHNSAIDWPAFALPHLIDPLTSLEILALKSLSPNGIYDALEAFERAQPVKTLKHVRILAANEYWSTRFNSDFPALADKLRIWTAQTGVRTEVIW